MEFSLIFLLNTIVVFCVYWLWINRSITKSIQASLISTFFGFFASSFYIIFFRDTDFQVIIEKLMSPLVWKSFFFRFISLLFFAESVFFFCMCLISKIDLDIKSKRDRILVAVSTIFFFVGLFLFLAFKRICMIYPITSEPVAVYYTLFNIGGDFDKGILVQGLGLFFLSAFLAGFCTYSMLFFHSFLRNIKEVYFAHVFLVLSVCFLSVVVIKILKSIPLNQYIEIFHKSTLAPQESEFYNNEYIFPEYKNVVFPDKKRNLIVLLCESMESSYTDNKNGGFFKQNLIPNLTEIAKTNINFSHNTYIGGGRDVNGTGWTIAAMTAKFAGLPFNFSGMVDNITGLERFLPNAVTLTDILNHNDYNQHFIFGSDKHFASRDALLESHGNVKVHDINWYKDHEMLANDYFVFWGFEDQKLFEYAKYELDVLSSQDKPFMFGLLTVDTHTGEGYICSLCERTYTDFQIKNVIRCSDKQIAIFVDWCKTQKWYENTTIVILGDHLFMTGTDNNVFGDGFETTPQEEQDIYNHKTSYSGKAPRRWLNIFINSSIHYNKTFTDNREFTSFDMFPHCCPV